MDLQSIPRDPFPSPPSTTPDPQTATCLKDAKLQKANLENQRIHNDNLARKSYGNRAFYLSAAWLGAIFLILMLQGFLGNSGKEVSVDALGIHLAEKPGPIFYLSDRVIMALIGGTTATVIGLLAFVIKSLFPSKGK